MVTADGGLTTAGYVITVIVGIILFFWRLFCREEFRQEKLTTRQLVFCAVAIALGFITSYLKIFKLPWREASLFAVCFIVSDRKLVWGRNWYYWLGLLTESCSLSRSLIYFHFSGVL